MLSFNLSGIYKLCICEYVRPDAGTADDMKLPMVIKAQIMVALDRFVKLHLTDIEITLSIAWIDNIESNLKRGLE